MFYKSYSLILEKGTLHTGDIQHKEDERERKVICKSPLVYGFVKPGSPSKK